MRLRKRDLTPDANGVPSYDMAFGHGAQDYWRDVPDAPAQLVLERVNLWTGQWFLDLAEGTSYRTAVLGKGTAASRDRAIRARILATHGVSGITAYASSLDRDARKFAPQVTLKTVYGARAVPVGPATTDVRYAR